jgi:hypothetical protein
MYSLFIIWGKYDNLKKMMKIINVLLLFLKI